MKKKSFAGRLSWKTVLITSGIFILALGAIAFRGGALMEKRALTYMTEVLQTTIQNIEYEFDLVEEATNSIARTVEELEHSGEKLDTASFYRLFARTVRSSDNILGAGVYYEPDRYVKGQKFAGIYVNENEEGALVHEWDDDLTFKEDGWDYFPLDWYANARMVGESIWTKPFLSYMMDGSYEMMTDYSYPMKDKDGEVFGVCAIDVKLGWLKDKLVKMKPYPNSNIAIIDSSFNFVCNPIAQKPYEGSALDTPFIPGMDYVFDGNTDKWLTDNPAATKVVIKEKGKAAFCIFGPVSNGWNVVVSCDYRDAFSDMFKLWSLLALISVLGLIFLFFSTRKIMHDETTALVDYAKAAAKITDGHFDIPIPTVNTGDEIEDLGKALSFMQTSVTQYIDELKRTTSEKERLASELDVARKIQMHMLSTNFPTVNDLGIYASSFPAKEVGGDLYDFFVSDNGIYFIVGDVSGKGVPAALLMAITISAFRAAGKKGHKVEEVVSLINDTFCKSNDDMMFVTLVVGHISPDQSRLEFCNAGHNPMVLIDESGSASLMHEKANLACGIMPGFSYEGESVPFSKGSRLLVYSDGITEAENCEKELYGEARLIEWANGNDTSSTPSDKDAVESLTMSVRRFTSGAEQNDDMTSMSISILRPHHQSC